LNGQDFEVAGRWPNRRNSFLRRIGGAIWVLRGKEVKHG
jgi:hypothetical protein